MKKKKIFKVSPCSGKCDSNRQLTENINEYVYVNPSSHYHCHLCRRLTIPPSSCHLLMFDHAHIVKGPGEKTSTHAKI